MNFCKPCSDHMNSDSNTKYSYSCCNKCGQVLDEVRLSTDVQLLNKSDDKTKLIGKIYSNSKKSIVSTKYNAVTHRSQFSDEKTESIRIKISNLLDRIGIRPKNDMSEASLRLYHVIHKSTIYSGKTINQILAMCCYVVCRQEKRPFMLIDFSEHIQTNLFTVGSIYINLCKLLYIGKKLFFNVPSDPCLYLSRFADRLNIDCNKDAIISTAIYIINHMKRYWIQTGRHFAGICGSALYMSLQVHNVPNKRKEILKIVKIGNSTLHKRLVEFLKTDTSFYNIYQFEKIEKRLRNSHEKVKMYVEFKNRRPFSVKQKKKLCAINESKACYHVESKTAEPYVKDLCTGCFVSNLHVSGGMTGFGKPPALKNVSKMKPLTSDLKSITSVDSNFKHKSNCAEVFNLVLIESKMAAPPILHDDFLSAEDLSDLDNLSYKELIHSEEHANIKYKAWKEMNVKCT